MDAFVNGQRTKVGMPRADVNTLTSNCTPDDAVTSDYNKKMNLVVNLINKTVNRIPESRSDGIKIYKAINAIINASPPEFNQNLESFRRYIHQWVSSLQRHKSLTDGSQTEPYSSFVE